MNKPITKKMETAMRFIYAHFLDPDESLTEFMQSRQVPRPNIRHLVRRKMYLFYGCTYKQIGRAEAAINGGTRTSHSTIIHSVHKSAEKFLNYEEAERTTCQLIDQFEDYWMGLHEPGVHDRLKHYYEMPHHVLAIITCFAEQFGWIERIKLEGLHQEFKTVSREFVEKEIG